MDAINNARNRNIIRSAYHGTQAAGEAAEDADHVARLRSIGRQAAENGWSLQEAYSLYEEYIESLDAAVEDEVALEGEDPGNLDYEDEDD